MSAAALAPHAPLPSMPALAPQPTPPTTPKRPAFDDFGEWIEDVTVAGEGTLGRLGDWIAVNRGADEGRSACWRRCQQANARCFRSYTVIRLARPSFFLPVGEVAFKATVNPTQIPETPPQGVMLRHLEAMNAHPEATFYYLEPVFAQDPKLRLCSPDELRSEADGDRADAFMLARNYGFLFRGRAWARSQARRCERALADAAERIADATAETAARLLPHPATLRRIEARQREARRAGDELEAERLERTLRQIRWRLTFDPILCFSLPDNPSRLYFEAHWYLGTDGRTYVHY